jgi:hypothetical protein
MNMNQATCGIRKNVLFILQSTAFDGDRNYQVARMALSVTMDAIPHMLFSSQALPLALTDRQTGKPLADFYGQERYLQELGIPCYVVREELSALGVTEESVRPGVTTISAAERDAMLKRMYFVITA